MACGRYNYSIHRVKLDQQTSIGGTILYNWWLIPIHGVLKGIFNNQSTSACFPHRPLGRRRAKQFNRRSEAWRYINLTNSLTFRRFRFFNSILILSNVVVAVQTYWPSKPVVLQKMTSCVDSYQILSQCIPGMSDDDPCFWWKDTDLGNVCKYSKFSKMFLADSKGKNSR